jgi:hypothetical protein
MSRDDDARQSLIQDAARASELFGDDACEDYAAIWNAGRQ